MRKAKTVAELAKLDPLDIEEADLEAQAHNPNLTEAEHKSLDKIEDDRITAMVERPNQLFSMRGSEMRVKVKMLNVARRSKLRKRA